MINIVLFGNQEQEKEPKLKGKYNLTHIYRQVIFVLI
jgi:hypothetical protein